MNNDRKHRGGNSWIIIPPTMGDPVFKCPKCGCKTLSPMSSCGYCGKQINMVMR